MNDICRIMSNNIKSVGSVSSPAVIYFKNVLDCNIKQILEELASISSNRVDLLYSIKACNNTEVINYISKYVAGFSVASTEEYKYVKQFSNKFISATGFSYNKYNLNRNTIFYFNSLEQVKIYLKSDEYEQNHNIGIRIKPIQSLFSSSIYPSQFPSQFGFSIQQLKELEKLKEKYHFKIVSILIHQENKVYNDYFELRKFIKKLLSLKVFKELKTINLGGGWDNLFLKKQIAKFITQLNIPNGYRIYIEPGSAIVRTIGLLKATAIDQSMHNDYRNVVLNTSQFNNSSWYVPRIIASINPKNSVKIKTHIYGNTCYERDYFGYNENSLVSYGSTVFLYPVGAYYYTTHRELHNISFPKEYFL